MIVRLFCRALQPCGRSMSMVVIARCRFTITCPRLASSPRSLPALLDGTRLSPKLAASLLPNHRLVTLLTARSLRRHVRRRTCSSRSSPGHGGVAFYSQCAITQVFSPCRARRVSPVSSHLAAFGSCAQVPRSAPTGMPSY